MTREGKDGWLEGILEVGTHSGTLVFRGLLQGIEKISASCHKLELGGEQEVEMIEAVMAIGLRRKLSLRKDKAMTSGVTGESFSNWR